MRDIYTLFRDVYVLICKYHGKWTAISRIYCIFEKNGKILQYFNA